MLEVYLPIILHFTIATVQLIFYALLVLLSLKLVNHLSNCPTYLHWNCQPTFIISYQSVSEYIV